MWAQTDSNRRPSACKADALNQLSYAPDNGLLFLKRWAQTDSNRRPSACKADALNQLSYAPFVLKSVAKLEFFYETRKGLVKKN